jgi:hypothetical protein
MTRRVRVPVLERLTATRVVARRAALDRARWPDAVPVLRTAPDEALVLGVVDAGLINDPHAIVLPETGMVGVWMTDEETGRRLSRAASWTSSRTPGSFAQGAVAGLPVKLWFEAGRVLWLVPEPFAAEFEARLA